MAVTKDEIIEAIKAMPALELSELVKELEETFGVSAAAPVMMGAMPAAGGAAEPAEEKTEFDVILEGVKKDEAEAAKEQLEKVGAAVTVK